MKIQVLKWGFQNLKKKSTLNLKEYWARYTEPKVIKIRYLDTLGASLLGRNEDVDAGQSFHRTQGLQSKVNIT